MVVTKNDILEILSSTQKRKGFHGKYLEICKIKNINPLAELKVKSRNKKNFSLDFHADRIKPNDWLAICAALNSDKTLQFLAIRLRKNNESVQEDVDTIKKVKTNNITLPSIYSKYVFVKLIEALQNLLRGSKRLEEIILEGLPIYGRYMTSLAKGLVSNHSIKILNLTRTQIGDDGCEILCTNIKHLFNIEALDLSNCNLGLRSAHAIRDFIKFQKIHRLSEAWSKSLRYQNLNDDSFDGVRKIYLNNNPSIGDEGLEVLTNELREDVWIKNVEMQNCGLTDISAHHIINCLNYNKTIMNFNICSNPSMSEHTYRHIMLHCGSIEEDRLDSSDTNQRKITKRELLEKLKFLEEQLESEVFQRKQTQQLNEQLHNQLIEYKSDLNIPEGYSMIANETLERLKKYSTITHKYSSNITAVRLRNKKQRGGVIPRKVKSCLITNIFQKYKRSKSEQNVALQTVSRREFIERKIGDYSQPSIEDYSFSLKGQEVLQLFIKKKKIAPLFYMPNSTDTDTE